MKEEIKQINTFVYVCSKCGRKFESAYKGQANNNGKIHEMNCKPKEEKNESKNNK